MKPLEFLADVLPSPGHGWYCAAELSSSKKEHVFVDGVDAVKPTIKRWLDRKRDIYFALATFKDNVGGRKATNAAYIKAIFIDMDGYASKKAAALALSEFLEKTGLDEFGTPHIVGSGGGLHCYWVLTAPVDIATWKPIAENFKRLCKQEGLNIDQTVTADAARVLRIPSTYNFKKKYPEPRPVQFLAQGSGPIDLKRFGATIRGLLTAAFAPASNAFVATSVDLPGTRPSKAQTARSAAAEAMMNNSVTRFEPIWIKSEKSMGCGQLEFYIKNAEQDGMEPLWRGLLSWAKVCDDGLEHSTKLTALHPYTIDRMHQKLSEIKGPYPCIKMDSENPGVCPKCPHWGQITNALALGREVRTDNREKEIEIPLQAGDDTTVDMDAEYLQDDLTEESDESSTPQNVRTRKATRPTPPRNFSYGEHGGVFVDIKEKDATGVEIKTQVSVLPYDLFVVDMLRMDEKEHYAHLMAIKKIGQTGESKLTEYTPVIMPSKAAVSKEELIKCLASHNIYAARGAVMDGHLYNYVRACIEESALLRKAVDVPIQFGWQKDRSFVYNNRVFRRDGTEIPVPMPGLENINRGTNSKGTIEGWRKPWQLLIEKKMDTMLALCLDSFGSPLMSFSDYEGFVWHIGSTGSGTGKSLTLSLKAGVWGHPIRYRTGKGTSPVAMQQRAGLLNSMPLLIDEITTKTRNDTEWAPAFIFDISEGQGKERMESGTNKERINNSTWALTCTLTSNTHMTDILTGARKHSSHGEMMRMLEWTPSKELEFSERERLTLKELRRNYGVAGEAWVRWLVQNQEIARAVWLRTHEELRVLLGFTDEERYWHAACTSTVAAGILIGSSYANLLDVPIKSVIKALKALVVDARIAHVKSARNAEDVLNTFTREYYGRFVVVRKDAHNKLLAEMGRDVTGKTSTRNTVMARIEHGTRHAGFVEYYVEEQILKQHCASMSFGFSDFRRQLEAMSEEGYNVRFGIKKDMLAYTDGPSLRVNVMHISIPKDRYDGMEDSLPLGEA
jgi:hypothetical protein